MELQIIADLFKLKVDTEASLLVSLIKEMNLEDANLYYNFPFYRGETAEELVSAHILLVSREYGVIFFRCLPSDNVFDEIEQTRLDDLDGHIFAKINKHEEFRKSRRELKINVRPCVFIPASQSDNPDVVTEENLKRTIKDNGSTPLSDYEFQLLTSVIEGSINLKRKVERLLPRDGGITKGTVLSSIQNRLASFDLQQKRAALNIIDSPQRIRGLAGSGKTVILTMKAALYHLQNPDAEILYTYFTKALFGQVKYMIEKFYRDFSDNHEPDWSKIHILHGWGGNALQGVYSEVCRYNGINPISFISAKSARPGNPFEYIFERLDREHLKEMYDLILIDEGQDFNKYFYRVCLKVSRNRRLVWAYDDFQNIFDVEIQDEKETFGKDASGEYLVDFSKSGGTLQDIVLYKSYRNPRQVLTAAFSLGLGIYNDRVLQRLENNSHWKDLGFKVLEGDSSVGTMMKIERPVESSPIDTTALLPDILPVDVRVFMTMEEETAFVADCINTDLKEQGLKPEDIAVICLDSRNMAYYFDKLETKLREKGIRTFNLLGAPNNNTVFSVENNVTLSTINKAKGNEVGMVYIVGADAVFANKDYTLYRNQLFTAMTRSKGWVVITGFPKTELCKEELNQLCVHGWRMEFIQPSQEETRIIYRGIDNMQSKLNEVERTLEKLSQTSGVSVEELMETLVSRKQKK